MIYSVELEGPDGKTYVAELEGPDNLTSHMASLEKDKPGVDVMKSIRAGLGSIMSPRPDSMAVGGLDVAQRFAQSTLGDIYGQARQGIQAMVPPDVNKTVGNTMLKTSPLSGLSNVIPDSAKQALGSQGVGLGIDVGAGLGVGALEGLAGATGRGIASLGNAVKGTLPDSKIAQSVGQAARALQTVERGFNNQYETMFNSRGNKFVPNELKEKIADTIASISREVVPDSPFSSYIENLRSRLGGTNGKELHALKQEIFSRRTRIGANKAASEKLYDVITDVLADKRMYGQKYNELTSEYRQFLTKEKGYVEDLIYDKHDSLTADKLKSGNLSTEAKKAFTRLSNRAKAGIDLGRNLSKSKMVKDVGKKAIEYAPWLGGSYIGYRILKDTLK